jgi:hypothetical protein
MADISSNRIKKRRFSGISKLRILPKDLYRKSHYRRTIKPKEISGIKKP